MNNAAQTRSPVEGRVSTGIAGLDDILGGGFPANRLYLIEGAPGTGKTTLALQFLLAGRECGERGLYVTLSESEEELRLAAATHGWSLDGLDLFQLIGDTVLDPEAEQTILHPSELELGETSRGVMAMVDACNPVRVVFDSLSEMRLLAQNPLRYRRQILALKQFFAQHRCTVLLLDDKTSEAADLQLHSIAHGVVTLEQAALDFGSERRRLRVVKLRGSAFRGGFHDVTIRTGGLLVHPRLIAAEHHAAFSDKPVSSGIAGLDNLMGGGLIPGTNTLLVGPSGIGKTSTATCCLHAALRRGEKAALFLFDEGIGTLLSRSAGLGLDLRPHMDAGTLTVRNIDPAELSPGEFAAGIRRSVESDGARCVVIDSLNAYLHSMPGEKFLVLQMHELLSYLNQSGVVTLVILGQHGLIGDMRSGADLSYLADSILLMRFFEAAGEMRKAISVVKTRTADHERSIREFRVGPRGIRVGARLFDFQGVLTGMPAWRGDVGRLLPAGIERDEFGA
ncbi:MAG TPA: ATPase domain-containing protein [Acetobacteraceae bacterium]